MPEQKSQVPGAGGDHPWCPLHGPLEPVVFQRPLVLRGLAGPLWHHSPDNKLRREVGSTPRQGQMSPEPGGVGEEMSCAHRDQHITYLVPVLAAPWVQALDRNRCILCSSLCLFLLFILECFVTSKCPTPCGVAKTSDHSH